MQCKFNFQSKQISICIAYNDFTFPKFEAVERLCVTLSIKRGCQPPHISGKVLLGIELPSGAKRQSEMGKRLEGKIVRDKIRSVSEFNSVT